MRNQLRRDACSAGPCGLELGYGPPGTTHGWPDVPEDIFGPARWWFSSTEGLVLFVDRKDRLVRDSRARAMPTSVQESLQGCLLCDSHICLLSDSSATHGRRVLLHRMPEPQVGAHEIWEWRRGRGGKLPNAVGPNGRASGPGLKLIRAPGCSIRYHCAQSRVGFGTSSVTQTWHLRGRSHSA